MRCPSRCLRHARRNRVVARDPAFAGRERSARGGGRLPHQVQHADLVSSK
ncbi:hypothetical protein [Lysobacter gummosus]